VKLMTYNIHGCIGRGRVKDPMRVLDVIKQSEADVIALQEVHNETRRDRSFLEHLAGLPYVYSIFGVTLNRAGADYGNVLLSRFPFIESRRIDLSVKGREPRGAIIASIQAEGFVLRVIATHLGLGFGERNEQLERLMPAMKEQQRFSASQDVGVLMGDINEWRDWGRPIRACNRIYSQTPKVKTFPSVWPLCALDRIWMTPRARLKRIMPLRFRSARLASDHLPLMAEIAER